jgi:urease accessory protein
MQNRLSSAHAPKEKPAALHPLHRYSSYMPWHAHLQIDYSLEAGKTVARHVHSGPLRVLQSLYPDGHAVCHNVLVHPPGGLVGGDTLVIRVETQIGAHGLLTTPGATRFYRSEGQNAIQSTRLTVAPDSRLQWLPLETICYSACMAENRLRLDVQPGGEMMGWDVTALGLPHANQPFLHGQLQQHLELPGVWLERSRIAAEDVRLLDGPTGLAGNRCMAIAFFVTGSPLQRNRRQQALDCAREALSGNSLLDKSALIYGMTSPNPQVVVARVLAPMVEPAMAAMRTVRAAWLEHLWDLKATTPRIWAM